MADNNYNPKETEKRVLEFWNKDKIFKFDTRNKKKIYSIDTPPPTVSGKMHIGHAFSYAQQDFIARFRRMHDGNVFYPFGTDDNGLPTERFVEKAKNVKSKDMSRSEFIELCLKTLKEVIPNFIQDWKDLGISADYECYYSTIDEKTQKISQKSFIDLFEKKEVYKKGFPTLWCCECQTAIAQAELEDKEANTLFSTLRFLCEGKKLPIATTRPELLGACVAVFVNPNDKRYTKLVGKKAKVPLFNFEVPIIADNSAQIDKGTGVLMICSYGDKYDASSIAKHGLSPRVILNPDGTINFGEFKGMKVKEARKKILDSLNKEKLIVEQKSITHVVNVHDKCGTEIEILPTNQWFVRVLDKKEELIKQGKKIKWYPEAMFKRYENWVRGLDWDWNISRNRHFGVPIPVWECPKCKELIVADEGELPVDPIQTKKKCKKCKTEAVGEKMVLDTWATSSLTPQIVSSLSSGKVNIPLSLRPQAHDIIRTWAFYTIVKAYLHEKEIPWKDIVVSGNVSLGGEKMSKSKGNVIEPREVLEKYCADSLRFWAAGSKLGEDLDYQEKDLVTGMRFLNKLWNASKFVFMNLGEYKTSNIKPKKIEVIDQIFISELDKLVKNSTESFINYEYSKVKMDTETFFWRSFCDNYLEIVKNRIYNGSKEEKESAKYVLYNSLLTILKIMAPITPFITEEIYQLYFKKDQKDKSIHISDWPIRDSKNKENDKSDKIWQKFTEILDKVRRFKSENQKSMKAEIVLSIPKEDSLILKDCLKDLKAVCCVKELREADFKAEFV